MAGRRTLPQKNDVDLLSGDEGVGSGDVGTSRDDPPSLYEVSGLLDNRTGKDGEGMRNGSTMGLTNPSQVHPLTLYEVSGAYRGARLTTTF